MQTALTLQALVLQAAMMDAVTLERQARFRFDTWSADMWSATQKQLSDQYGDISAQIATGVAVIRRGTNNGLNDQFIVDCEQEDGSPVRVIVHCRSLQFVRDHIPSSLNVLSIR